MSSKLGKVIANFNSQLSTKVAVGGTTASINSKIDADGVTIPNGRYFVTFDSDNSRKEHFSCVLTTTSSGADLTALKTVNRTTGVETSGALREHKIGAKVTITDFATIAKLVDILNGVETLDGSSPLSYDAQPTLSSGTQLATVQYVLDHVAGGTVSFDQQVLTAQTSGEALTANDIGYFKELDQKWYKADADITATFDQLQLGIVKSTVAINSGVSIAISGPVGGFTGLTAGSKYYLSNTPGEITTTAGTYSVFIGWALNTTTIMFNPLNKTAPTQKEKDALAGSSGVPSSTNKFVTQDNTSSATTDQTQTTQNGTVELGEANATTKKNKIAQSFIPTKTKIRGVNLYKSADLGTFTGTVTVSLQADNSGSPSGSALATKTFTNLQWIALPAGEFEVIFTSEYAGMTAGSLYWVVIETSTSDNSNHPNLGVNTAGGYSNGSVKFNNSTDGWTAVATIDLYFSTIEGNNSQAVVTDTSGKINNSLYDYASSSLRHYVGVGDKTNTSWVNFQLPLLGTTNNGWTGAIGTGDINMRVSYATTSPASITGAYAITSNAIYYSMVKKFIVDFTAIIDSNATSVVGFTNTNLGSGHGFGTNTARITFEIGSAKLYASMANGSARTEREIGGVTLSNQNRYRIEVDTVNSTSTYYVNGIQVAKNTTNFPSGLNKFAFGVGTNGFNGTSSYSAFNFSVEI